MINMSLSPMRIFVFATGLRDSTYFYGNKKENVASENELPW